MGAAKGAMQLTRSCNKAAQHVGKDDKAADGNKGNGADKKELDSLRQELRRKGADVDDLRQELRNNLEAVRELQHQMTSLHRYFTSMSGGTATNSQDIPSVDFAIVPGGVLPVDAPA